MTANQAKSISSPHRGADGTSDRACASANNCARRARNQKAASAAETRASQNRTAPYPQRGNNNEHQPTHLNSPDEEVSAAISNGW
jgi:hypothetical protein